MIRSDLKKACYVSQRRKESAMCYKIAFFVVVGLLLATHPIVVERVTTIGCALPPIFDGWKVNDPVVGTAFIMSAVLHLLILAVVVECDIKRVWHRAALGIVAIAIVLIVLVGHYEPTAVHTTQPTTNVVGN